MKENIRKRIFLHKVKTHWVRVVFTESVVGLGKSEVYFKFSI